MTFELPDRHQELRERARKLADEVRWHAGDADAASDVDPVMRDALRGSGLVGLAVPTGPDEVVDPLAVTVVREAFGGSSRSTPSPRWG